MTITLPNATSVSRAAPFSRCARVLFHLLLKHQLKPWQEQATTSADYSCTLWKTLSSQMGGGTDTVT